MNSIHENINNEYERFNPDDYLGILDLFYKVVDSLKGLKPDNPLFTDCQQLATKIYFHSATIYKLRQGTDIPIPIDKPITFFYDFASTAVLVRVVLEAYLNLYEIFFSTTNEDKIELNHALWKLSGFVIREDHQFTESLVEQKFKEFKLEIHEIRNRIKNTETFKSLKPKQKGRILNGKQPRLRNWHTIAVEAGFGENYIKKIFRYFSGYVHSDALSGAQIYQADGKLTREYIDSHMRLVMGILSKVIILYQSKFKISKMICLESDYYFRQAQIWSEVLKRVN